MMKYLGLGILAVGLVACQQENKIESKTDIIVKPYPETKKVEQKMSFSER